MSLQQSNSEDQGSSREGALPTRVRRGVEALLNERAAVASFLQKREEELVAGEYSELYEALRGWGESRPDLFECLGYLMAGSEQFADDVEADFGQEALGNIAEIQDRFIQLRSAILKIQLEQTYGLYNNDLEPELTNVDPGHTDGMPVMHIDLMSAEETLAECQVLPSTALECGARLLAQTAVVLEKRGCDWEELAAVEQHNLNKILNELPELFDKLPEGEPADAESPGEESRTQRLSQSYVDQLGDTEDEPTSYIY